MDIIKNRRNTAGPEQYPGGRTFGVGTSDNNLGWDMRAQSWHRGADTDFQAIEDEKREQDLRFGTPHADNFPAPSDPQGPANCGARYQTASYNGDSLLPNPHNFSSNPGFMSASTGDMASSGAPKTATIGNPGSGRSLRRGFSGGVGYSDNSSRSDYSPQTVTSGFNG
ncbi:MAG: hypothetical protein PVS2B2_26070 [Candidatus Acidiferrum sp.]